MAANVSMSVEGAPTRKATEASEDATDTEEEPKQYARPPHGWPEDEEWVPYTPVVRQIDITDKEACLEAVKKDGLALQRASDELQGDYDCVLAALKQRRERMPAAP